MEAKGKDMNGIPKYRDEVMILPDSWWECEERHGFVGAHVFAQHRAENAGFNFYMFPEPGAGRRVFDVDYRVTENSSGFSVCDYAALIERPEEGANENPILIRVTQYLASPKRSVDVSRYVTALAQKGFWSATEEQRAAILQDYIPKSGACRDGQERFWKFMNGLVDEPSKLSQRHDVVLLAPRGAIPKYVLQNINKILDAMQEAWDKQEDDEDYPGWLPVPNVCRFEVPQ